MKLKLLEYLRHNEPETFAYFGDARLVKHLDGRFELLGGSPADHTDAKEWISLFLHNAVISFPPTRTGRGPTATPALLPPPMRRQGSSRWTRASRRVSVSSAIDPKTVRKNHDL